MSGVKLTNPVSLADDEPLGDLILRAKARVAAMTPEERLAMIQAQRESWVRGMTARCEHGQVDYEQCPDCRALSTKTEGGE